MSVKPLNGWSVQADKTKLATPIKSDDGEITEAVTKITWTATPDAAIKPGQFQEFDVSVGPLPETDKIVFKALQTYSDGDIVRWIEEPGADGKEPVHPAPTLKLAKASSDTSTAGGHGDSNTSNSAATKATDADARSRANAGLGLGIAALVLALVGVALGGLAWRRRPTSFDAIVAAVQLGLSNSRLEGINAKIRLIQRRGHGHRNLDNLTAAIYLCLGAITINLPTQR